MTPEFLKSPSGADPIIVEGLFKASAQRLFEAWTSPDDVKEWFGPGPGTLDEAEIDLQEGGAWRFAYGARDGQSDELSGLYEEINAPKRLVFSWVHTRTFEDGRLPIKTAASKVTITFEDRDGGGFVRLVHEAISSEDGRMGVGSGWEGTFTRVADVFGRIGALQA